MARTILIVDNAKTNREILKQILGESYGYAEAADGQEAMRILRRDCRSLSAVLADLAAPAADGFDVLRQMRRSAALSQLPVIVMTDACEAESEEKALEIGASDCIRKPYSAAVVRARVRNAVALRELGAALGSPQDDGPTAARGYQSMLPVALKTVIGSTSDLSFIKDGNLRYICCSPAFARMAGLPRETDIVGKTDGDIVPKNLADAYAAADEEILRTGRPRLDYDERLPDLDGASRYGSTSKYPLLDESGRVIGIYGLTRDVTEFHTAYERLKLLADSIQGGLATYTCTWDSIRISYYNDTFGRLMGYSRDEFEALASKNALFMVCEEYVPILYRRLHALMRDGQAASCVFRIRKKDGELVWVNFRGTLSERRDDHVVVNAVFFDVTEQMETTENLRLSEEQYRLATRHSGNVICRYSVADRSLTMPPEAAARLSLPERIESVPESLVQAGEIAPESVEGYEAFYEGIRRGEREGEVVFQKRFLDGWKWIDGRYSTVFSDEGEPVSAVISYEDVTERREKEAVYQKWQHSLREKSPDSYTLFRCNLSKNASFDSMEGTLLNVRFREGPSDFGGRTREYAEQYVLEEDRRAYAAFLNSDAMLANYYRGKRSAALEYREKTPQGGARWLRLTADLVEYPNSEDVEAFLMYENIDETKRDELEARERAEADPLTGLLNRNSFAEKTNQALKARKPGTLCALMMFDLDGFKLVNDSFGHAFGDQALIDVATKLRSLLRREDLVGRLGGDEFFALLCDMPNMATIAQKARMICDAARRAYSVEVGLSASLGIALCPDDGEDFETLYRKADVALYHVKATGKDSHAFYEDGMKGEEPRAADTPEPRPAGHEGLKRRMLIVEDNPLNREMLSRLFEDEFLIDTADEGGDALIRLRRYGTAISVVLLDLIMPGMDGFAVLEKMRSSPEMQSIPVIVVSGMSERETSLRTIRCGASDYVTKPVDPELLRIRVRSAVTKAENERLRAQNTSLSLIQDETARYRAVLESEGTVIVGYDAETDAFTFDRDMGHRIAGRFDGRSLWDILLADAGAEKADLDALRGMTDDIARNAARGEASMCLSLKTPSGARHRFRVNAVRRADSQPARAKLALAFTDSGGD